MQNAIAPHGLCPCCKVFWNPPGPVQAVQPASVPLQRSGDCGRIVFSSSIVSRLLLRVSNKGSVQTGIPIGLARRHPRRSRSDAARGFWTRDLPEKKGAYAERVCLSSEKTPSPQRDLVVGWRSLSVSLGAGSAARPMGGALDGSRRRGRGTSDSSRCNCCANRRGPPDA